jgi:multisubunit Na+/H+ antiporter MnhC subunit
VGSLKTTKMKVFRTVLFCAGALVLCALVVTAGFGAFILSLVIRL